jgi:Mor family transcriptional regulator
LDYKKGAEVLPARLLKEIQEYVDGGLVYIPKRSSRAGWGDVSGARRSIDQRNRMIVSQFTRGASITELADQFHLGEDTIKKIVYRKKQI